MAKNDEPTVESAFGETVTVEGDNEVSSPPLIKYTMSTWLSWGRLRPNYSPGAVNWKHPVMVIIHERQQQKHQSKMLA